MHRQKRHLLIGLLLAMLTTATAQKTIVSRKPQPTISDTPSAVLSSQELLAAGDSCMSQYDTHAALAYYQQAYNQRQDIETRQKLANCLYQRCDYRQCVTLLKGLPMNSISHDAQRQLFFCYAYLKDDQQIMDCGEQLLRMHPMDAEVLARLCTVLCDNNKTQQAVINAQAYRQRDSTNLLINRTLANCLYLDRQYRAAIHQYQQLMAAGDTTFLGLYSTGMAYEYLGNKQQAYTYLSMAMKRNSKSSGCQYRLGIVCVDLHRYEEALEHLYKAEDLLQPDKIVMKVIADHMGRAYYAQENYSWAIEAWKKAREYDGSSLAFIYNIAASYAALYEQNKNIHPNNEEAIRNQGLIPFELEQVLKQDMEQAKRYYGLFLEMALEKSQQLDDETKLMMKEAQAYLEAHP